MSFNTTLWDAAISRDLDRIQEVLATLGTESVRFGNPRRSGMTIVHLACKSGWQTMVEVLIRWIRTNNHEDLLDLRDENERTGMHHASLAGHEGIVALLVAAGSNSAEMVDKNGMTPFHLACASSSEAVIGTLLSSSKGVIDLRANDGSTAMHAAAMKGDSAVVELLVQAGSMNIDAINDLGFTPLHIAAKHGHENAVEILERLGSRAIDSIDNQGRTPMHLAASCGQATTLEALVHLGSKALDAKDKSGCTPIQLALESFVLAEVQSLLATCNDLDDSTSIYRMRRLEQRVAEVSCRGFNNQEVNSKFALCIAMLRRLGSNLHNLDACTILHVLAQFGHTKAIAELMRCVKGAASLLDSTDLLGRTPLHYCASKGNLRAMENLVRLGSRAIDSLDKLGCSPLHLTSKAGSLHSCDTLIRLGSKIDLPSQRPVRKSSSASARTMAVTDLADNDWRTPIHSAVLGRHPRALETLIRMGSRAIDAPDRLGNTPIYYAALNDSEVFVQLLRSFGASSLCLLPRSKSVVLEWLDTDSTMFRYILPSDLRHLHDFEMDSASRNVVEFFVTGERLQMDGVEEMLRNSLKKRPLSGHGMRLLSLLINSSSGTLQLGNMQIGDAGCKAVADGLKINTTLDTLFLSFNQIGPDGIRHLADALKINSTLTSLDLNGNTIGDSGSLVLADALRINSTLMTLHLYGNKIGFASEQVLRGAFSSRFRGSLIV